MKIDLGVLNNKEIESTGDIKEMELSKNVGSIIFQIFTSNIYSNPIGSIVREITTNCFDSHVEADVNKPVIIRMGIDETTQSKYISFIDFGVGMSPQRIDEVYSVYFESTKRNTNDEMGGFGIGGKTPLAYKRMIDNGNYDNSFFLITIYNGIKYVYNIYEGKKSPQYVLLHKEKTNEHNGTEVRVPVLQKDIYKFESELIKQLYYFDNIIFEGFSDRIQNDYKIYKGKNFLYRGDGVSDYIHVCLGKVAYPIDYSILNLDANDYSIPIAINVPIGKINVVTSREHLDYSEETISYLKEKLADVINELKTMLSKQHDNVVTLSDYFKYKKNIFKLNIFDNKYINLGMVMSLKDIQLNNFKYKNTHIPNFNQALYHFFNVKRHGAIEKKKYYNEKYSVFYKKYDDLNNENVYYVDENFRMTRKLKSYLIQKHGRFYILTKKTNIDFNDKDILYTFKLSENNEVLLKKLFNDYWKLITEKVQNIKDIVIPQDFFLITKTVMEKYIPATFNNDSNKHKIKLKRLMDFKGVIFYTDNDNLYLKEEIYKIFTYLYRKHYDYIVSSHNASYGISAKKTIMFISVAKSNIKYLKKMKNTHNLAEDNYFYLKYLLRKEDALIEYFKYLSLSYKLESVNRVFFEKIMKEINEDVYNIASKVTKMKKIINEDFDFDPYIFRHKNLLQELGVKFNEKLTPKQIDYEINIEKLNTINDANHKVLTYINLPFYDFDDTIKHILKKVLILKKYIK